MTNHLKANLLTRLSFETGFQRPVRPVAAAWCAWALLISLALSGCQAPPAVANAQSDAGVKKQPAMLKVREGDVLKISFPAAANLDTTQQVRRDGRINLAVVGELVVTGMTPNEIEQELIRQYSSQLLSKEVSVTVLQSTFSVFVNGAVLRPGKITTDRPITILEAIMESGGFDNTKANLRAVVVTRQEDGQYKNFTLNLKLVLEGKSTEPFYLQASDIVTVPEKFSWF